MNNRKYIREEGINSRTDGKGKIFAHRIFGENTELHFVDRQQGPDKYNGHRFNRIIFTVTFSDFRNCGVLSKYKDTGHNYEESLLVQYALDLMEDDTYEEFYKTALLLTKNRQTESVKSMDALLAKFDKGEYAWPITKSNVNDYRRSNELWRKIVASIGITKNDLKYFAQYEKDGLNTSEDRFDY